MVVETCPLLDELPWIKHGFYGKDNPAQEKGICGVHSFTDQFPETLFLKQTHSDAIATDPTSEAAADAAITSENNLGLAIKTADCCPILLVCTKSKQIGAVHAGWRGALNRITAKTVEAMIAKGADPRFMIAAIGPSIHQNNLPVQDDVRDQFRDTAPETIGFFKPFRDRWIMDVAGIVTYQLEQAGIKKIWQSPINTFKNPDYSSYREYCSNADVPETRNISVIMKINT